MFPARRIVCPTDFSEASLQALAGAGDIALHNEAEVFLIHVIPVSLGTADRCMPITVPEYERFLQPQRRLEELAQSLAVKGVKVQVVLGRGDAASEIVRIAKEKAADVIVIATHGNTGWRHLAFGSVAEKVVRYACCAVLTIRAKPVSPEKAAGPSKP
jgi:nucleotide-binding universal stress UspA family protein